MKTRKRHRKVDKPIDPNENVSNAITIISSADTTCSLCYAEFVDVEELERHVFQVHLDTPNKQRYCKFCTAVLPSLLDFAVHIRDKHLTDLRACQFCYRLFNDQDKLLIHEKKHQVIPSRSMYSCSQCGILFSALNDLESHEYYQHLDCMEGLMIKACFPLLSSLLNVKAQSFLQSLGKETMYSCINCNYSTSDVGNYITHASKDECQSVVCDTCSNVYKNRGYLRKHFLRRPKCFNHEEHELINMMCKICHKFFNSTVYNEHVRGCKTAIVCKICKESFQTVSELSSHQVKKHPLSVTLTSCKYCGSEFVGKVGLMKHIDRRHKNELHLYKYKCRMCNEIYKHPKFLFTHFFTKHRDLQPYTCKICDKKFRTRKAFTIHIKIVHKSVGWVNFDDNFFVFFTDVMPNKMNKNNIPIADHDYSLLGIDDSADANKGTGNPEENENICQVDVNKTKQAVAESEIDSCIETDIDTNEKDQLSLEKTENVEPNTKIDLTAEYLEVLDDDDDVTTNETDSNKQIHSSKRKLPKRLKKKTHKSLNLDSTDDDEPLIKLKNRNKTHLPRLHNRMKRTIKSKGVTKFSCNICKKYCYTFQNYNRHMSMHLKNESKQCVKCGKLFKRVDELKAHIKESHSQSKLTEALKKVLERQKDTRLGSHTAVTERSDKFKLTVKKVDLQTNNPKAKITDVTGKSDVSAKNFLETFTPESNVLITGSVTWKAVIGPLNKPTIKMIKMKDVKENFVPKKLAMPVKFRNIYCETEKAKLNIVQGFVHKETKLNFGEPIHEEASIYDRDEHVENVDYMDNDTESVAKLDYYSETESMHTQMSNVVPEVAHEIMLEGTDDTQKKITQRKIIVPQLPQGYDQIRIAHLLPEAPYFKIVKVDEIIDTEQTSVLNKEVLEPIQLPGGTKLVHSNPLQHLLNGKQMMVLNKYQKKKNSQNFERVIAKALQDLESPNAVKVKKFTRKKREKKEDVTLEQ